MEIISSYTDISKYHTDEYKEVSEGVFLYKGQYVTAFSFRQEPELGEGNNASEISQYPLEDILDRFSVYVSDFFSEKNISSSQICYLEFTGCSLKDVSALRSIIGKHVYNREIDEKGQKYIELVIE